MILTMSKGVGDNEAYHQRTQEGVIGIRDNDTNHEQEKARQWHG